jgi:transposase-like protein
VTKRKKRTFTTEFKQDAVRIFESGERTITEVSRSLDVATSVLRSWVKQHAVDTGKGKPGALVTTERDELARLRRENRQLREDREILKKAATFLAKERG